MKKKVAAMALSVVMGLSVFGGIAQAQTASAQECAHTSKRYITSVDQGYEPISGSFHNKVTQYTYLCNDCGETIYEYTREYEDHTFLQSDAYGHWYCYYCGFVDDTTGY